jgi:hypothetical protein
LFTWVNDLLKTLPTDLIPAGHLPLISDFQQRLETLMTWRSLDGAQLATHLQTTLQTLAQFIEQRISTPVQQAVDSLETLTPLVPLDTLRTAMQTIDQELRDLAVTVNGGDLSGVNLTNLNNQLDMVNTSLTAINANLLAGQTTGLITTLNGLPQALDIEMRSVLNILNPGTETNFLDSLGSIDDLWNQAEVDDFTANIQAMVDWLKSLIDGINLQAIREPLQTVINTAQSTVGDLNNLLVERLEWAGSHQCHQHCPAGTGRNYSSLARTFFSTGHRCRDCRN